MKNKTFCLTVIFVSTAVLFTGAATTFAVDPLFHYRKPMEGLEYPIDNERYQNDGILKNFEYNAVITGTSMAENFKTTEFDQLFGTNSVKVPFSGASYKEINDSLRRAFEANPDISIVLRPLDMSNILEDPEYMKYDSYPDYLYDNNIFNDVYYLLNKTIFVENTVNVFKYTKSGGETTTFDEYANWTQRHSVGKENVLSSFTRSEKSMECIKMTPHEKAAVVENLQKNYTQLADAYPDTIFYVYFSPYSICWWDNLNQGSRIDWTIDIQKTAIEELLSHSNIHLYSFFDNYKLICNLDNYKDKTHYGEHINTKILEWINAGEYRLTSGNYLQYIEEIKDFYAGYDYDKIYE